MSATTLAHRSSRPVRRSAYLARIDPARVRTSIASSNNWLRTLARAYGVASAPRHWLPADAHAVSPRAILLFTTGATIKSP